MKKIKSLLFILFLSSSFLYGQTIKDATLLLKQGQPDSAIAIAKKIIETGNNDPDAYILIGRALMAKEEFRESISYLNKVQTLPNVPSYAKAWSMNELGTAYYALGEHEKSKNNILGCIQLNATENSTASAKQSALLFGFNKIYDSWVIRETNHFIFHFQDTTIIQNLSQFITNKEFAFDSINGFFHSTLPKKIDYFVWRDVDVAEKILKQTLAFTKGMLCLTHTDPFHSLGHEMTHSISKYAFLNAYKSRLISEGIAVYFDFSGKDNLKSLSKFIHSKNIFVSVKETWKNNRAIDDLIYPMGGELVKRLIQKFGREKFLQLYADQTWENAEKIFGEQFDSLISEFENDFNNYKP